jgi:hypothetical protein
MKLKLMIMCALFAAGVFASFALADGGNHGQKASDCREVHISGTIAPQTLAVTVDKASDKSLIAAGTQLSLAVGTTGQTVRVKAEACSTGAAGAPLVLTVKQVELRVSPAQTATTETGTTGTTTTKHGDEHGNKDGEKHHTGVTTTTATTTAATTTTAGTTTGTTTTHP